MVSANGITVEEAVTFGTGGGRDLKCDIYTPSGAANAPALLLLYGGGWRMGDRGRMRDMSLLIAGHGYVVVAGEYRLTPESAWPAQIHDVKANIRWMRANAARLRIDPEKIAVQGHSAGAHLALLAAGTPNLAAFEGEGGTAGVSTAVAAAVGVYPPVVFHIGERVSGSVPAEALMLKAATPEMAAAAAPLTYVTANFPPTFLLHGTEDKVVPVSASTRMQQAMSGVGAPVELKIYNGLPHGFANIPSLMPLIAAEVANFLDRHMAAPERFKRELEERAAQAAAQQQAAAAGARA